MVVWDLWCAKLGGRDRLAASWFLPGGGPYFLVECRAGEQEVGGAGRSEEDQPVSRTWEGRLGLSGWCLCSTFKFDRLYNPYADHNSF